MHRWFRVVLGMSLVVASVLAASPVHADHRLSLVHQPQPAAVAGHDLTLLIGVHSDCGVLCQPVVVRVAYVRPDGSTAVLTRQVRPSAGRAAAVKVTVPAVDVRAPGLAYRLSASQARCWPFAPMGPCDEARTRSPQHGAFDVDVHG